MKYHYQILQLPHDKKVDYMFMDWDWAHNHGFQFQDYKEVYSGEIEEDQSVNTILEKLFYIFNMEHPSDFHGHSMSVSDIIVLNGVYYYCNSIGFMTIAYKEEE